MDLSELGSDRHAEIADEEERYRAAARNLYGSEDVEVDEGATVSRGDDAGAFVAAWVWVRDSALAREVV